MSYDIYLNSTKCPHCGQFGSSPNELSPTYNLTPIFDLALTGEDLPNPDVNEFETVILGKETDRPRGLRILNGLTGSESLTQLNDALGRLGDMSLREKFLSLEPENGWGNFTNAVEVFSKMQQYAIEYPDNTWEIR